jgi:hypothetical protein
MVVSSLNKIGIQVKPRELATSAAYTTIQTAEPDPHRAQRPLGQGLRRPVHLLHPVDGRAPRSSQPATPTTLVGLTPSIASKLGVKIPAGTNIPNLDADINCCQKIPATDPSCTACWADLDKKLMEQAVPWIPYLFGLDKPVWEQYGRFVKHLFAQGMGQWVVTAVFNGDFPAILAVTVVTSLAITLMNLFVDIVYAYLDPRVRYT